MSSPALGKSLISPKVALILSGDGSIKVVDAITLHFTKGAVDGRIVLDTAARLTVKWSLEGARTRSGGRIPTFDYRATLAKKSRRIELTATRRGFDTGEHSMGTCKKRST